MILFQKDEAKLLWPFYLELLVSNLFFILLPFEVLYFLSIGLSVTQIGLLIAMWPLAALFTDILTGAIADLYGRKFSVITGYLFMGLIFLFIPSIKSYPFLLLAYAILGVFYTFTTGSDEAWVVDNLKKNKHNELVKSYFSRQVMLHSLGLIGAGIIGGFLVAKFGLSFIWYSCSFSLLISILILAFAKEKFEKQKIRIKESFKRVISQTKKTIVYSYWHRVLFYLLLGSFFISVIDTFGEFISWTPFLSGFGFKQAYFGYLFAVMSFVAAISPLLVGKILKKNNERKILIITSLIWVLFGVFIIFLNSLILALIGILIASFLLSFEKPIRRVYFHRFVSSKIRATMGSVESTLSSLGSIIAFALGGYLVDLIGSRYVVALSGLAMIIVFFLYLKIKEKRIN